VVLDLEAPLGAKGSADAVTAIISQDGGDFGRCWPRAPIFDQERFIFLLFAVRTRQKAVFTLTSPG
jgi:hypothetical protein